jgi:hypothetical protein
MTGVALSLIRLLARLVIALAVALLLALVIALARSGSAFRDDLGIACLLVGCLCLLLVPAGHSPAMRGGTIDTWTASFFPKLVPGMAQEYSGTTVSAAALFGLTGVALIVVGVVLAG